VSASPQLSRRLVLEERRREPDGAGGALTSWVELGTLWAEVTPRAGRESFEGGRPVPRLRHRIVIRAAPTGAPSRPRPDQRFRDGARILNILTVSERGPDGRFLLIEAEEGVES
jgi:head-tail adaptor